MELMMDTIPSPIGKITLVTRGEALCALDFEDCRERTESYLAAQFGEVPSNRTADPGGFSTRLKAYFAGELDALDEFAVETRGTEFQREVWARLKKIPVGATISYGELAASIGRPNASRAVGMANGQNPVSLVLPCHRVIGTDGALTGYGGGIERKRWLLKHEGALLI